MNLTLPFAYRKKKKRMTLAWNFEYLHYLKIWSEFDIMFLIFSEHWTKIIKMSSRKTAGRRGTTKKRAQRATSNVFAMFNQDQIQEFKEAFNMIDQNRDGFIDHEDLHDMLASLGKDPTEDYLEGMMGEAPGPINFTMFLTMFGERLQVKL